MAAKLISLRYDSACSVCTVATPARSTAWWDQATKQVICTECAAADATDVLCPADASHRDRSADAPTAPWAPPAMIDTGTGGVSAAREYERRKAKHERQIEARWGTGRIGRLAKLLSDEPQSTVAWARGAEGERRLAMRLNNELDGVAVVLHDRKVPGTRGNIDHLVVAPTGVWLIDAKNYTGKVEVRDVGGWFKTDLRLYVANRDKSNLVEAMGWQVDAVRKALTPIGFGGAQIHPVLCFTNSEWPLFAKPQSMDGVRITWPANVVEVARADGPWDEATVQLVAHQLSGTLPAAR